MRLRLRFVLTNTVKPYCEPLEVLEAVRASVTKCNECLLTILFCKNFLALRDGPWQISSVNGM